MRVLIADAQMLFRAGLAALLSAEPDFQVVGQTGRVREAIDCAFRLKPDLMLLDLALADGSGFDVLRAIGTQQPESAIVVLTANGYDRYLVEAIRLGAKGFLQKEIAYPSLVAALRGIRQGEAAISRKAANRLVGELQRLGRRVTDEDGVAGNLTARERQILTLLRSGASNTDIAAQLVISKYTAKVHVHNMRKKLSLTNRAQLVRFAQDNIAEGGSPMQPV
jgi:DNA-binding NarL/FixJ family response regulator